MKVIAKGHMELPDFLTIDDGGFIHVTGRRVGLHHILRGYNEGLSPEEIALEYPSLQLSTVHKVIAFYLDHADDVEKYIADHDLTVAQHMTQSRPGPTVAELRARLATRQPPPSTQRVNAE
ncbi:MAG TPA: DUF433 domain-containing protein [Tepidisphaeraceae bacterium]|nr:DUF433 domain-containing protein [Tepidisphaeraceae bacterium]